MASLKVPSSSVCSASRVLFRIQQQDDMNKECCDGGSSAPLWASVPHGVFVSIEAAGVHRSLGVRHSLVLSTTMDTWQPTQLRMMELGGNRRFNDFMSKHGVPQSMPIREKYSTRAAAWYRENLRAEVEGRPPPPQLFTPGTGHLPANTELEHACEHRAVLDRVFASLHHGTDVKRHSKIGAGEWSRACALPVNCKKCCMPCVSTLDQTWIRWVCEQLCLKMDQCAEGILCTITIKKVPSCGWREKDGAKAPADVNR
eukprot:TRINITY_DN17931_c0_g1_i2.p1 TRINITY_DN17931_c0_g1~~TRINITY_DN17931_c0_g1_i2.p1  ORF type:complete len:287 (+),score=42.04 TRINITY_DN17931_c0_g1_i2:91-861(+)